MEILHLDPERRKTPQGFQRMIFGIPKREPLQIRWRTMNKKKKPKPPVKKRRPLLIWCLLLAAIGLTVAFYMFADNTRERPSGRTSVPASSIPQKQQEKSPVQWSDAERRDMNNILLSYAEVDKADAVLATKTPQTLTAEDLRYIVQAFEKALSFAELVSDGILEKVHPEMKTQFRQNYQPGIRRMLHGFKHGDQSIAREGASLYQAYGAWVFSHAHELSFPDQTTGESLVR